MSSCNVLAPLIANRSRSYLHIIAAVFLFGISGAPSVSLAQSNTPQLEDAYGFRLGIIANEFWNSTQPTPDQFNAPPATTGMRPLLNPYYEVSLLPGLTATANLMLVYRSFAAFGLTDFRFQSYGFNCSMRWDPSVAHGEPMDERHYFLTAGLGFDTFTDRVSISMPLSAGELFPLSKTTQLEIAGLVTYQQFLELGPGMYLGITAGIRFLNFE